LRQAQGFGEEGVGDARGRAWTWPRVHCRRSFCRIFISGNIDIFINLRRIGENVAWRLRHRAWTEHGAADPARAERGIPVHRKIEMNMIVMKYV
jgi:hypothetical protein